MSVEQTEQRIKNILSEQLGIDVDRIQPYSSLDTDLGVDSLDRHEIVMEIEQQFTEKQFHCSDPGIAESDSSKWTRVGDIVRFVEEAS